VLIGIGRLGIGDWEIRDWGLGKRGWGFGDWEIGDLEIGRFRDWRLGNKESHWLFEKQHVFQFTFLTNLNVLALGRK
jgi:hypothetical protein